MTTARQRVIALGFLDGLCQATNGLRFDKAEAVRASYRVVIGREVHPIVGAAEAVAKRAIDRTTERTGSDTLGVNLDCHDLSRRLLLGLTAHPMGSTCERRPPHAASFPAPSVAVVLDFETGDVAPVLLTDLGKVARVGEFEVGAAGASCKHWVSPFR